MFSSPWWLPGGHLQTICAVAAARRRACAFERERWETPDGDFIDVDFAGDAAAAAACVLFHGLEGGSDSHYARAIAARRGGRAAGASRSPHFRGCSGEPNRMPRAYHSGDSEEIDWILRQLRARRCDAIGHLARRQCAAQVAGRARRRGARARAPRGGGVGAARSRRRRARARPRPQPPAIHAACSCPR